MFLLQIIFWKDYLNEFTLDGNIAFCLVSRSFKDTDVIFD